MRLRWTPGGAVAGVLREGDSVQILYERETVDGTEWLQVIDQEGRIGWIGSYRLVALPLARLAGAQCNPSVCTGLVGGCCFSLRG